MADHWRQSKSIICHLFVKSEKHLYPPRRAIFRLRLYVGESSQANRPPGIVADRQTPNSPRTVVDAACSLNNTGVSHYHYDLNNVQISYFAYTCELHEAITACGTGCSTNNIRITNCRAISGSSLLM